MKSIVLYGLKNESNAYQCVRYEILSYDRMTVSDLKFAAADFAQHYGAIDMVYAANDHHGLRDHYREAIATAHTEQDSINFKLYLEQVGVRVY